MTAYEKHLLVLANEELGCGVPWYRNSTTGLYCIHPIETVIPNHANLGYFQLPTLAEALAALLSDLGVEVPEPPSAERVAQVRDEILSEGCEGGGPIDRDTLDAVIYHPDRLAVLALLEGGES